MTRSFGAVSVGAGCWWLALALAVAPARSTAADDQGGKPHPLEGAWRMVTYKNGDAVERSKLPEGYEQTKLITGGRFVWTLAKDGKVLSAAGGKYTVEGNRYVEHVEYVLGEGLGSLVGKDHPFTWKVDGTTLHQTGVAKTAEGDYKIDEIWERCR
jgi:hypothetical protein